MPRGGRAVEGDVTTGGRKYAIGCPRREGPHWNTEEKKRRGESSLDRDGNKAACHCILGFVQLVYQ